MKRGVVVLSVLFLALVLFAVSPVSSAVSDEGHVAVNDSIEVPEPDIPEEEIIEDDQTHEEETEEPTDDEASEELEII